jgi:hypothetical protein
MRELEGKAAEDVLYTSRAPPDPTAHQALPSVQIAIQMRNDERLLGLHD